MFLASWRNLQSSNSQDSGGTSSSCDAYEEGYVGSKFGSAVPTKPRASSIDAAICATTAAAGIPLLRDRLAATNPAVVGYRLVKFYSDLKRARRCEQKRKIKQKCGLD
jgi:hypothetical protein